MLMVELLSRMPDLRRRIQRDHVSDVAGRCRDCHGARWPCEMYQLAMQADRLHACRSPWPPPPHQNRGGPIPPPRIRRDPMPPPAWPGSRSYPPLGGPASWPAQRVQPMPAAPSGRYPTGPASPPSGWPADPPPARATPYPARAAPAWPTPPPVPPPRSGSPSWPSAWTPEVPAPRHGGDPLSGPVEAPGPSDGYPPDAGLGWDRNAPPRHSLGFPPRSRTHPPEPRRELSSVLEDVLRWSR
jgi:hypothetical protein